MNTTIHKLACVALMAGCTSEFNPNLGNVGGSVGSDTKNEPTGTTSAGGGNDGGDSGGNDESTGPADPCGNGILENDEECDGNVGCKEDCELEFYECNPLTQTRCPDGLLCAYDDRWPDLNCISQAGSGKQADPCNEYGSCDPGYVCVDGTDFIDECDSLCCSQWCDLKYDNCPTGHYCRKWFISGSFDPGMDHLGNCVSY